jgi:Zn-finger nucleic acid-binding protein
VERSAVPTISQDLPSLADLAQTVTESNSTTSLTCPDCFTVMSKDRFHSMIPVQIDRCDTCGHIWLDAGEQKLRLRLYHELVNTTDAQVADKRAKVDRLEQLASHPDLKDLDKDVAGIAFGLKLCLMVLRLFI